MNRCVVPPTHVKSAILSHAWASSLIVNLFFFIVCSWLLPIHYEENDDVMMCMIANGIYGGQPDCHLVFINAIIGCILKFLYNISRSVEWYTLFLSIIHVLSFTAITYKVLKVYSLNKWLKIICLLTLYLFWIRIIATFQFTTTAGIAAFAGCILLLHGQKLERISAFVLILVSAMIRFEVAGLMLLLFSPLFVKMVIDDRKHIATFFILTLLLFSLPLMDKAFYSSPEWKQYKEYNFYRGKVNDNPNFFRAKDYLPDGITFEEYIMFIRFRGDGKVFTQEKVKSIYDTLHNPPFMIRLKHLKSIVHSKRHFIPSALIILSVLLGIVFSNTSKTNKWYLLSVAGIFIGLFILISSGSCLKDRVFLCMLLPMMYVVFLISSLNSKYLKAMLIIAMFTPCLMCYYAASAIIKNKHDLLSEELICEQEELLQSTDSYVYGFDCGLAMQNVWHIKEIPVHPVVFGWLTNIPLSKNVLYGYDDFVNNNIVIFTKMNDVATVSKIQKYLFERYHISSEYKMVNHTKHYVLYKLTKNPQ